jgi:hypothetical protein
LFVFRQWHGEILKQLLASSYWPLATPSSSFVLP